MSLPISVTGGTLEALYIPWLVLFTTPYHICLIYMKYYGHHHMIMQQTCVFFTNNFYTPKKGSTFILVKSFKAHYLKLRHLLHFLLLLLACMGKYVTIRTKNTSICAFQYSRYPSTARGISLAVNDCTLDVQVTSDRPITP